MLRSLLVHAAWFATLLAIAPRAGAAQASRMPDDTTVAAVDSLWRTVLRASVQRDTATLRAHTGSAQVQSVLGFLMYPQRWWRDTRDAVPAAQLPKPCQNGATLWRAYGVYPHGDLPPFGRYVVVKFEQRVGRWQVTLVSPALPDMTTLPCCAT